MIAVLLGRVVGNPEHSSKIKGLALRWPQLASMRRTGKHQSSRGGKDKVSNGHVVLLG
jgi:hypothetical protein